MLLFPCCLVVVFFFLLPSLSSSLVSPLKFQPKTKWYQAGSCEEAECAVQSQTANAWHGAVRVKHEICLHFSPDGSHSFRKWNADGLSCKINSRQGLWSLSIMSSEQRRPCLVDLISFFLIPKIHTDDTPWIHLCKMTWKPFFFHVGVKRCECFNSKVKWGLGHRERDVLRNVNDFWALVNTLSVARVLVSPT